MTDQNIQHPALMIGYKKPLKHSSLEARIENALFIMAKIIATHGEDFLPIYERLEQELELASKKQATLQRAITLARTSNS